MRSYAKTSINDSDIVFSMEMFNPQADGFGVHILGSIDNRNILDATLFATTITLACLGQVSVFFGWGSAICLFLLSLLLVAWWLPAHVFVCILVRAFPCECRCLAPCPSLRSI